MSEPFGIAPLEAMGNDVPVLISRSSGVSEVLTHALKVDFWDVDEMANKIVAVLRHPPLGRTLREHGRLEVRRLTWDGAAAKTQAIYERVTREAAIAGAEAAVGVRADAVAKRRLHSIRSVLRSRGRDSARRSKQATLERRRCRSTPPIDAAGPQNATY